MRSDYEILVSREIRRGKKDPKDIANSLGLPEPVVEVAMRRVSDNEYKAKKIEITKDSLKLLIDVLILYLIIAVLLRVVAWF